MKTAAVVACALFLTSGVFAADTKWYRTDGRPIPSDPALLSRAEADLVACRGEEARARLAGHATSWGEQVGRNRGAELVLIGCMADRGYVVR